MVEDVPSEAEFAFKAALRALLFLEKDMAITAMVQIMKRAIPAPANSMVRLLLKAISILISRSAFTA